MFRKVQLKFFGIIIGILIAIFIGVIFSINVIMNMLMDRQTNVVLHKVAQSVDFDAKTKSFTFTNPEKPPEPPKKENKPPVVTTTTEYSKPTETKPSAASDDQKGYSGS